MPVSSAQARTGLQDTPSRSLQCNIAAQPTEKHLARVRHTFVALIAGGVSPVPLPNDVAQLRGKEGPWQHGTCCVAEF